MWWIMVVLAVVVLWVHPAQLRAATTRRTQRQKQQKRRLPTVPPVQQLPFDVLQHLETLVDRFRDTRDWSCLVDVANVYDHGWYPQYRSNKDLATTLFELGSRCPDPDVSRHCMIQVLIRTEIPDEDNGADHLPLIPGYSIAELAQRYYHQQQTMTPTTPPPTPQRRVITNVPEVLIPNDPQNVHDHGVMRSLSKKLKGLPVPETLQESTVEEVRAYILDCESTEETKRNALETLDSLSDVAHSVLGMSEQDALHRVWGSVDEDTKAILVTQLASSVENGSVVCSTGKMGRMVGTFDGIHETPIRPLWAIREEIGSLAASMRDTGKTSDDFRASCLQTYVSELGMNPQIISSVVDEYAPYINQDDG
jgi:hypothetical protein